MIGIVARRAGLVGGLIWACLLAGAAGALAQPAFTPVAGSPFATGSGPLSVAFSPGGGLLATANESDDTVSVFAVGSGGALTPVAGSPFATGDGPFSVAFSPGGGLLATANESDDTVSVFAVGSGGALTPVAGSLAGSQAIKRAPGRSGALHAFLGVFGVLTPTPLSRGCSRLPSRTRTRPPARGPATTCRELGLSSGHRCRLGAICHHRATGRQHEPHSL